MAAMGTRTKGTKQRRNDGTACLTMLPEKGIEKAPVRGGQGSHLAWPINRADTESDQSNLAMKQKMRTAKTDVPAERAERQEIFL
jgi:hypothetical protein